MIEITVGTKQSPLTYDSPTRTFTGSEKDIPFATTYTITNSYTGNSKEFKFSHSTGPEFDPNTDYVYKCGDLTLIISNDEKITNKNAKNYLKAKMQH